MPRFRIPLERLVQPVGDASELADGDGTCSDFDVRGGAAARADAVEPIAKMAAAIWQLEVARHGRWIDEQVGRLAADPIAADADLSVRADECDAVAASLETAMFDAHAVGIPVSQRLATIMARRADADGSALVGIHRPLDDIEMVGAPIGKDTAGIIAVGTPCTRMEAAVVGPVWGGAEPHVPIHPFWSRLGGKRAFRRGAADRHMGGNHLSKHTVTDELDGSYELASIRRALLHSSLENTARAADFADDIPRLTDGQRQRLFAVDVLSRVGCHDAHRGMPVVGRADDNGIKVRTCKHVPEITVLGTTFVLAGFLLVGVCLLCEIVGVVHLAGINVTDGNDLHVRHFEKIPQMSCRHSARADDTDGDSVVGGRGENLGRGDKRRHGGGGSKSFQECASVH